MIQVLIGCGERGVSPLQAVDEGSAAGPVLECGAPVAVGARWSDQSAGPIGASGGAIYWVRFSDWGSWSVQRVQTGEELKPEGLGGTPYSFLVDVAGSTAWLLHSSEVSGRRRFLHGRALLEAGSRGAEPLEGPWSRFERLDFETESAPHRLDRTQSTATRVARRRPRHLTEDDRLAVPVSDAASAIWSANETLSEGSARYPGRAPMAVSGSFITDGERVYPVGRPAEGERWARGAGEGPWAFRDETLYVVHDGELWATAARDPQAPERLGLPAESFDLATGTVVTAGTEADTHFVLLRVGSSERKVSVEDPVHALTAGPGYALWVEAPVPASCPRRKTEAEGNVMLWSVSLPTPVRISTVRAPCACCPAGVDPWLDPVHNTEASELQIETSGNLAAWTHAGERASGQIDVVRLTTEPCPL